jgi:hypothetical protein
MQLPMHAPHNTPSSGKRDYPEAVSIPKRAAAELIFAGCRFT